MEQSYRALSLRKDRIPFACVFLFCLCIPKYIYVCLCICVSKHDCIYNRQPTVRLSKLFQLCSEFCLCQSRLNLGSRSLPQLCLSLTCPPLYNSSETPEPKHLTPVSLCTDYVVIAETMGQLNLHHLNLAVVLL